MNTESTSWFTVQDSDDCGYINEYYNINSLVEFPEQNLAANNQQSSSAPQILSFEAPKTLNLDDSTFNFKVEMESPAKNIDFHSPVNPDSNRGSIKRNHSMIRAQDHVLAERKRRQNLNEKFVALSAIVPGLKKMDKASVIGDAIKYVKELEGRVKVLEEMTKRRTVESIILATKKFHSHDDDFCSCDELPEIEAKVSGNDLLMRVHCLKEPGVVPKILDEILSIDRFTVVNSSVLPFANSTLNITIIAKIEAGFNMSVRDLVKMLRVAVLKFM